MEKATITYNLEWRQRVGESIKIPMHCWCRSANISNRLLVGISSFTDTKVGRYFYFIEPLNGESVNHDIWVLYPSVRYELGSHALHWCNLCLNFYRAIEIATAALTVNGFLSTEIKEIGSKQRSYNEKRAAHGLYHFNG